MFLDLFIAAVIVIAVARENYTVDSRVRSSHCLAYLLCLGSRNHKDKYGTEIGQNENGTPELYASVQFNKSSYVYIVFSFFLLFNTRRYIITIRAIIYGLNVIRVINVQFHRVVNKNELKKNRASVNFYS